MVMNEDIDKLNRVFLTQRGLMFYTHHEGCIIDDGVRDPLSEQITDGVMIEFKENKEDGAYFMYTNNFGLEEEVKLLGILGSRVVPKENNKLLEYNLEFHKCIKASPVALEMDPDVVLIATKTVDLEAVGMDLQKSGEEAMTWLITEYRKYFKDLFPKQEG